MKKEIMHLLSESDGALRLNNILTLRRRKIDIYGDAVDILFAEFDPVNGVNFPEKAHMDIQSRDYSGIIQEVENCIDEYLQSVSDRLRSNLINGYLSR